MRRKPRESRGFRLNCAGAAGRCASCGTPRASKKIRTRRAITRAGACRWAESSARSSRSEPSIRRASRACSRRSRRAGPDGAGTRVLRAGRVALGHRRLAILDLSENAAQPMTNEDGTLWLTFNGEIYNFRELRKQLEARGPPLPLGDRLRGDPARLRGVGRRLRAAAARDLRLRPLGRPARAPAARARPPGREAALLLGARGGPRLRLAAARDPRAPALPPRGRRARVPALPRVPLRARRSRDLGGNEQAARRAPARARPPRPAARALLGGPLRARSCADAPRRRGWCATSSRKPCACSS